MSARSLENRVAVVTGASRNIGRAIALELAREGAAVVVNARSSSDEAESVAAEIRAQGGKAVSRLADVTDPAQAKALAWRPGIERFWVHTCTLDSPAALGFYIKAGFTPFAREVETFADPRLAGVLPREAAPHVPLLG